MDRDDLAESIYLNILSGDHACCDGCDSATRAYGLADDFQNEKAAQQAAADAKAKAAKPAKSDAPAVPAEESYSTSFSKKTGK